MPMLHFPSITLLTSGLLGLLFVVLSARVVAGRVSGQVMHGGGETPSDKLSLFIRGHANFAEFVPLALILIGLLELRSGPTLLIKVLAAVLVVSRIAHPIGLHMKAPNPFRAGGFFGTLLVIAAASVAALAATLG